MDEQQDTQISDEQLLLLIQQLPTPVQEFLKSNHRNEIVLRLSSKYGLHADQAGVFESAFILMMLGVNTPADFSQTLERSGISQATARALLNDINTEVFLPLRTKERESVQEISNPAPISISSVQKPVPPPPSYAPPAPIKEPAGPMYDFSQPSGPVHTASPVATPAPTPIYTPPAQTAPTYTPPAPAKAPEPAVSFSPEPPQMKTSPSEPPQGPTMRTFASDVEQMKHGQAPHPYTQGATPTFTPSPVETPMPTMAPREVASVPQSPQPTYTPPPAPHITPPPPIAQPPTQTPVPTHPPRRPEPTVEEVTHSLKQYGIDPYREPIE